jgi:hypothetical protein
MKTKKKPTIGLNDHVIEIRHSHGNSTHASGKSFTITYRASHDTARSFKAHPPKTRDRSFLTQRTIKSLIFSFLSKRSVKADDLRFVDKRMRHIAARINSRSNPSNSQNQSAIFVRTKEARTPSDILKPSRSAVHVRPADEEFDAIMEASLKSSPGTWQALAK